MIHKFTNLKNKRSHGKDSNNNKHFLPIGPLVFIRTGKNLSELLSLSLSLSLAPTYPCRRLDWPNAMKRGDNLPKT